MSYAKLYEAWYRIRRRIVEELGGVMLEDYDHILAEWAWIAKISQRTIENQQKWIDKLTAR